MAELAAPARSTRPSARTTAPPEPAAPARTARDRPTAEPATLAAERRHGGGGSLQNSGWARKHALILVSYPIRFRPSPIDPVPTAQCHSHRWQQPARALLVRLDARGSIISSELRSRACAAVVWSGSCNTVRRRGKGVGEENHGLLCAAVLLRVEEIAEV